MEETANKRAENMIMARKRHFEELMIKKNHYLNMSIQEDRQRELNIKRRLDNKSMIQAKRIEVLSGNMQSKEELMKNNLDDKIKAEKLKLELLER